MEIKPKPKVAYFCMEYGLDSEFKLYAGGLGILAGDYLKAAKDNSLPVVGIGLLWKEDYTQQYIGNGGYPYDTFPKFNYDFLKDTDIKVVVNISGRDVYCKVWKVDDFNNAPLYLLDTDIEENKDWLINDQLYGGFSHRRIPQEMVLGIGGIRALRKLGIDIDIYHFNEGHAVFAGIELIREKMYEQNMSFQEAWKNTRNQIVFTTHTPVRAGNEEHDLSLMWEKGAYNWLSYDQITAIGGDPFNMTIAGLRLSKISNAVSQLHCETANRMWNFVDNRSQIIGITNGVHKATWMDSRMEEAFKGNRGLWETHVELKKELIEFVKNRTGVNFKPDSLLIGFARRSTEYKRSTLILKDEEKLSKLLKEKKIQLLFSGKAHPQDFEGKSFVQEIVNISQKHPDTIAFLENYDMEIAKKMTRGCDVWLNSPRRPHEASGTSGMKAAMNGVLNLSILDGWWPEACNHGVNGWQFGDSFHSENSKEQDRYDLKSLYKVLLNEVLPTYYNNRQKWIQMMKSSIDTVYEKFSAKRMILEYFNKIYTLDPSKQFQY
ncbi:MAG: glycogen phosphorylase [Thermosediminibacterales bacterium]|nr:glycogen phosphorylase [Thermosediminibacterales bacterium]MDK2835286.1 glycogen phosphorylase [Thermosediminibacterales bacterium]